MKDYYRNSFQADLRSFLGESPVPYFGHGWSHSCREQVARIASDKRARFLICLYFTVLVDQCMHAHFGAQYSQFDELARYPKFCHGLSQFQHNPRGILLCPVEQGVVKRQEVLDQLADGMALFVDEVDEFCRDHMPDMDPCDLFERMLGDPDVQIPELLALLNPDLQQDVAYVAYTELRAAVGRSFPRNAG
jgi:hypothetical protein